MSVFVCHDRLVPQIDSAGLGLVVNYLVVVDHTAYW